jgi:hypothetical protein
MNEIESLQNQINILQDKLNELLKETTTSQFTDVMSKNGFILESIWGGKYWIKEINKNYSFWFNFEDDVYMWGISDNVNEENFWESDNFENFDECYANYVNEKDNFKLKRIKITYISDEELIYYPNIDIHVESIVDKIYFYDENCSWEVVSES